MSASTTAALPSDGGVTAEGPTPSVVPKTSDETASTTVAAAPPLASTDRPAQQGSNDTNNTSAAAISPASLSNPTTAAPPAAVATTSQPAKAVPSQKTSLWDTPEKVLSTTLWECTAGIPRRELKLIAAEADECETALQAEIALLEAALVQQQQKGSDDKPPTLDPAVQTILDSPFTPMDRCWTLSALLGRLRGELAPTTLVSVQASSRSNAPPASPPPPTGTTLNNARQLLAIRRHAAYTREQPAINLLPVWKRIFSNRLANVFKKAVKDEDAPGYAARIRFPMDLSLVRKRIVARQIKCLADLHVCIALIAHNCVKYNGRETDYGIVAREFEQMADDVVRQAVLAAASSSSSNNSPKPPSTGAAVAPGAATTPAAP